jgi:GntR family transcriptional regulator, transcriptional repressor for pyruvate dehydrogenase complex
MTVQIGRVVRAPKTAELIASDLRRQIVRGDLKSGATLPPEMQLMAQYGVSRPTLREAFRILETETLITVRRGARGGAQVMTPDLSAAARSVGLLLQIQGTTLDDVFEARMGFEPYCARLLARRRTKHDLAALRGCIDEVRLVVEAGVQAVPDPARWSSVTYRFHELVMERSGNRTLALQGALLQDIVATHLQLTMAQTLGESESPARFHKLIRSYEKLVRLVDARDADGAEEHWRRHLEATGKFLLDPEARDRSVELFA